MDSEQTFTGLRQTFTRLTGLQQTPADFHWSLPESGRTMWGSVKYCMFGCMIDMLEFQILCEQGQCAELSFLVVFIVLLCI